MSRVGKMPITVPQGVDVKVANDQITVKGAIRLAGRVAQAVGTPVTNGDDIPGLKHAFPRPDRLRAGTFEDVGMPKARAAALVGIAAAAAGDPHLFDPRRDLYEAISQLCELPGIGEWTAQYIAMRALGERMRAPSGRSSPASPRK